MSPANGRSPAPSANSPRRTCPSGFMSTSSAMDCTATSSATSPATQPRSTGVKNPRPSHSPRTRRRPPIIRRLHPSRRAGVVGRARVKPRPLTRIERQCGQSLDEMLAELPVGCDTGCKRNSRGFTTTWNGYKLHLERHRRHGGGPAILTSASVHDSQVAIPLARKSEQRIVWLYDVRDAAYDAAPIVADCQAAGRGAIIDRNTRRQTALKVEIAAERTACRTINMPDPDDLIYNERTAAERVNGAITDDYGGRHLRVRGHLKVFCHLMFGVVAFTASCLLKLFEPYPAPA